MKLPRLPVLALLVASFIRLSAVAADNSVLYWNEEALKATRLARNPPPLAAEFYATFHVAIFDAVNGITRAHQGWLVNEPAPAGADLDAAVAGAAYTVLKTRWSASSNPRNLQTAYDKALAAIPDSPAKTAGIAWGVKVAEAIIANRNESGFNKPIPGEYSSTEQGKWRETPSGFRPPTVPHWRMVKPFVMTSPSQFRAPPPYAVSSKEHAEEMRYVNQVGVRDGSDRTEYQTLSAPFWADDLGSCTPPGHWNMIAQDLSRRNQLSVPDAARLFALLNMAEADAGIACWDTKFFYNTWRPETAIREIDPRLNPEAMVNPEFIPNLASPSFPAYTSGHSTFSAAGARTLALFFGTDDIEFSLTSDGLPGAVRTYKKLSDAQREAGMSRIWGGIHYMSDNLEGQKAGVNIADWTFANALQPVSKLASAQPVAAK
ncbi:MAG TPA: phosphatase PAP2 family protein [Lacunisphaera sp.]|nr:phosphatase PAP2 family protein [Lacunisphaera sp.]